MRSKRQADAKSCRALIDYVESKFYFKNDREPLKESKVGVQHSAVQRMSYRRKVWSGQETSGDTGGKLQQWFTLDMVHTYMKRSTQMNLVNYFKIRVDNFNL